MKSWFNARKSESVETLPVQIVARDGNGLFRCFRPFVAFETIQNDVQPRINPEEYEMYMRRKWNPL
jgi:hypothetical protein